MANFYAKYPLTGGGTPTYANLAAFPATANDGTIAVDLSTDNVYVYNKLASAWEIVAGPSFIAQANTATPLATPNTLVLRDASANFAAAQITSTAEVTGNVAVTNPTAAVIPVVVKAAASQSVDVEEWQTSAGVVTAAVTSAGVLSCPGIGGVTLSERFGKGSTVNSNNSVAVGNGAGVGGTDCVSVGKNASAGDNYSVAVGSGAKVNTLKGVAIGNSALAQGGSNVTVGYNVQNFNYGSVVLGTGLTVSSTANPSLVVGAPSSIGRRPWRSGRDIGRCGADQDSGSRNWHDTYGKSYCTGWR